MDTTINPQQNRVQQKKGRRDFILLMVVFSLPIIFAIILYNTLDKWYDQHTINKGNLINPARPLPQLTFQEISGKTISFEELQGKWLLVHIGTSECDISCADNLYKMRQSRLAQGGELKRVDRLYISTDGAPKPSLLKVLEEHPGLHVVTAGKETISQVINTFQYF